MHQCRGDTPWSPKGRDGTESVPYSRFLITFKYSERANPEQSGGAKPRGYKIDNIAVELAGLPITSMGNPLQVVRIFIYVAIPIHRDGRP